MKKLTRSKNKKLAGVCAGVAEYFNIDPTLVRLGAIVLAVSSMFTFVIAYIIAAAVIPSDGDEASQSASQGRSFTYQPPSNQTAQNAQAAQNAQQAAQSAAQQRAEVLGDFPQINLEQPQQKKQTYQYQSFPEIKIDAQTQKATINDPNEQADQNPLAFLDSIDVDKIETESKTTESYNNKL